MVDPTNLAKSLTEEELKKIGADVRESFDADKDSRSEADGQRAQWKKLFAGQRDPKNYPWPKASNTHVPLMTVACLQFQARAYEALVGKEIARCYCKDLAFQKTAERASRYLNYQLRYEMEEWEEDMDVMLLDLPMEGYGIKKTYWDTTKGRVASRFLVVDELIAPYRCKNLDESPRKTHIIHKQLNDIFMNARRGIYINVDENWEPVTVAESTPMPQTVIQGDKNNFETEPALRFVTTRPILEQHCMLDLNYDPETNTFKAKDNITRPYIVTVDWRDSKVLRIVPRFHINPYTGEMETDEYFTAYPFIPNPDSYCGFGFGHLIGHINETADTIINQLIDAGHLANVKGGFYAGMSGMKQGDLGFKMGEFKPVNILTDDIRKHIYPMEFGEPSNVLFTLLGLLQDYVKDVTTTADWMSGALPPSDTAATTMLAIIEQGLKVFSVIQKRAHRSLKKELRKIFRLNGQFLNEKVYFMTVFDGNEEQLEGYTTGKNDFSNDIEVIPVSDPNISSRAEKLIKSQQVMQSVMTNPLSAQDPQAIYSATKQFYEAMEVTNIDAILPKPPEEPPPPPDLPPQEENAMALKETGTPALPQQDHVYHIDAHRTFLESSWQQELTPQGKKVMEAHIREHLAFAYMIEQAAQAELLAQGGMYGGFGGFPEGGGGTVAPQPDNEGFQALVDSTASGAAGGI